MHITDIKDFIAVLGDVHWSAVVAVALLAAGFFYGVALGKTRLIAILLATYPTFALHPLITPYIPVGGSAAAWQHAGIRAGTFLVLLILITLILVKTVWRGQRRLGEKWWHVLLLSALEVGLLVSIMLQFLPEAGDAITAPLERLFTTKTALAVWLTLPFLGFIITKRKVD